jgi:hypothetical protein
MFMEAVYQRPPSEYSIPGTNRQTVLRLQTEAQAAPVAVDGQSAGARRPISDSSSRKWHAMPVQRQVLIYCRKFQLCNYLMKL